MKKYLYLFKTSITTMFILLIIPALLNAQQRKIKPGDGIEIIVYGHNELSRTVYVSPQGTINFPFIQNIPVDGQTLEKIRELIAARLKNYLPTPPVVTASFVQITNMVVHVLGHVGTPGVIELPLKSRLQGAIFKAGNFLPGAIEKSVTLIRNENGTTTNTNYNIELFILNGDLQQNPVLEQEDIIIVTGIPIFAQVKVLGAVQKPGTYAPPLGATVMDMIFMAGGFIEEAKTKEVKYISLNDGNTLELEIDFRKYFESSQSLANIPTVKEGDMIIVPRKKKGVFLVAWGVLREVLAVAQAVYYFVLISRYYK
jgi:polysaccharide biosynthesis/export protein